jgi:hypothetical protein
LIAWLFSGGISALISKWRADGARGVQVLGLFVA